MITTQNTITTIDFEQYWDKNHLEVPFIDFLRSKGSLTTADSYQVSFPVKIPGIGAEFSANETASDIGVIDPEWVNIPYIMTPVGRRIGATNLAVEGNTYLDPYAAAMNDVSLDIFTAIDEKIISCFSSKIPNSVDNIFHDAGTASTESNITVDLLDNAIDEYVVKNGFEPDFILITKKWLRELIASETNKHKRINGEYSIGEWNLQYQSIGGMIPFIIDQNMTNRFNTASPGDYCILGHTKALRLVFLENLIRKELPRTDFDRQSLFSAFVSFKVVDSNALICIANPNVFRLLLPTIDGYRFDIVEGIFYDVSDLTTGEWSVMDD